MSAYYDLYQTPDPLGENRNEPRLHARILPRGTISADKFRELVAKADRFQSRHSRRNFAGCYGRTIQLAVRGLDGGSGRVGLVSPYR